MANLSTRRNILRKALCSDSDRRESESESFERKRKVNEICSTLADGFALRKGKVLQDPEAIWVGVHNKLFTEMEHSRRTSIISKTSVKVNFAVHKLLSEYPIVGCLCLHFAGICLRPTARLFSVFFSYFRHQQPSRHSIAQIEPRTKLRSP